MQFLLSGWLGEGDEDVFARNVCELIEADNSQDALKIAKQMLSDELLPRQLRRNNDKHFHVLLYRPIWESWFVDAQPAQPALPAKEEVMEHKEERTW